MSVTQRRLPLGAMDASQADRPSARPLQDPQGSSTEPLSRDFGGEGPPSFEPGGMPPPPQSSDVRRNLGAGSGSGLRRWMWRIVILAVVAGLVAGVLWRSRVSAGPEVEFVSKPVTRGALRASVTATGNLQGRDTVEVGAEESGTVKAVYVDFNDEVERGQVLCEIDPEQLTAFRDQSRAQLMAAQAEYANRKVTSKEARATADRTVKLAADGLVSQQQLETATAAADRADAATRSAAAQITVAQASLQSAETKLEKTKIVAPMDGIVLARNVEVGQTVAASLQAPVLFTLARSLTEMELTVAIDEADIGQVDEDQPATFTVDAFPDRSFEATMKSVHNIGTTVDDVVTYEALLSIDNDDRSLRPGMTATASIVTASRKDALLVPNAALRFSPPSDESGPGGPPMGGLRMPGMPPGPPPGTASPAGSAKAGPPKASEGNHSRVWVLEAGKLRAVQVKTGLSDGTLTEILEGELDEGVEVVTDMKQLEE